MQVNQKTMEVLETRGFLVFKTPLTFFVGYLEVGENEFLKLPVEKLKTAPKKVGIMF